MEQKAKQMGETQLTVKFLTGCRECCLVFSAHEGVIRVVASRGVLIPCGNLFFIYRDGRLDPAVCVASDLGLKLNRCGSVVDLRK